MPLRRRVSASARLPVGCAGLGSLKRAVQMAGPEEQRGLAQLQAKITEVCQLHEGHSQLQNTCSATFPHEYLFPWCTTLLSPWQVEARQIVLHQALHAAQQRERTLTREKVYKAKTEKGFERLITTGSKFKKDSEVRKQDSAAPIKRGWMEKKGGETEFDSTTGKLAKERTYAKGGGRRNWSMFWCVLLQSGVLLVYESEEETRENLHACVSLHPSTSELYIYPPSDKKHSKQFLLKGPKTFTLSDRTKKTVFLRECLLGFCSRPHPCTRAPAMHGLRTLTAGQYSTAVARTDCDVFSFVPPSLSRRTVGAGNAPEFQSWAGTWAQLNLGKPTRLFWHHRRCVLVY